MVSCSTRSAITPRRAARYLWIGARVSAMIRSSSASLIASDTGGLPVDDCEVGEPGGEGLRLILERDRVAVTGAPVGPVFPGERHLGGEAPVGAAALHPDAGPRRQAWPAAGHDERRVPSGADSGSAVSAMVAASGSTATSSRTAVGSGSRSPPVGGNSTQRPD